MTQHTAGPWTIGPLGIIKGGSGSLTSVCETYRQSWANSQALAGQEGNQAAADWCRNRYTEMEANAQLIAAAPDLLEAAIAMRMIGPKSTRAEVNRACELLDAAIRKAGVYAAVAR